MVVDMVNATVGKLGSARVQTEERKQVRDKEVRDERGRRELQRPPSPPLIYFIYFNWSSKLIFKRFLFYYFGFVALWPFLLFFVQSLLLVNSYVNIVHLVDQ